jgi:hypothetical protein
MLKVKPTKVELALVAVADSTCLAEVARLCADSRFDGTDGVAKGDAMVYRQGSAGVLAGALAAHHEDHRDDGWRSWLPAARVALSALSELEEAG